MAISSRDRITAALTLWGEARGESREGKVAVMWVIRNRAEADLHGDSKPDWWGESIRDVCLRPGQFSCWNKGDPNRRKLLNFLLATDSDDPDKIEAAIRLPVLDPKKIGLQECLEVVDDVCMDRDPDPTHGSTHYHRRGVLPSWAIGHVPAVTIGGHAFYADIEPGYRPKLQGPSVSLPEAPTATLPKPPVIQGSSGPPDPPALPAVPPLPSASPAPVEELPERPGPVSGLSFWNWLKSLFGA